MVWKAKALFDYEAADTDELSFKEGELITITEKSDTWWTGKAYLLLEGGYHLFRRIKWEIWITAV